MPAQLEVIENPKFTLVEVLEKLLDRAKAGEFTAMAFAATKEVGMTTGWVVTEGGQRIKLVGAMDYVKFRINRQIDEED